MNRFDPRLLVGAACLVMHPLSALATEAQVVVSTRIEGPAYIGCLRDDPGRFRACVSAWARDDGVHVDYYSAEGLRRTVWPSGALTVVAGELGPIIHLRGEIPEVGLLDIGSRAQTYSRGVSNHTCLEHPVEYVLQSPSAALEIGADTVDSGTIAGIGVHATGPCNIYFLDVLAGEITTLYL